jgi:hypothetical protein
MAKVNKLALARLALRETLKELDKRELLCVLADIYVGNPDESQPRWYGNGSGTSGLEQGIYNHMTTFRRVANLWTKILHLQASDPDKRKKEIISVRDWVVKILNERGNDLKEIEATETDE